MDGITDFMDVSFSKLQELVKDREACLACCSPWGRKESDTTESLNWTELRLKAAYTEDIFKRSKKWYFRCFIPQFFKIRKRNQRLTYSKITKQKLPIFCPCLYFLKFLLFYNNQYLQSLVRTKTCFIFIERKTKNQKRYYEMESRS